jgi:hypothetical protein
MTRAGEKEKFISAGYLKRILSYDPITGEFAWKEDRCHVVKGQRAGTTDSKGYRRIGIDGRKYAGHRLAWLYYYGIWPTFEIDHRDHIRTNNAINNLRDVSTSENLRNRAPYKWTRTITRSTAIQSIAGNTSTSSSAD